MYHKKYLIKYLETDTFFNNEQTGGAQGLLTIITSSGRQISGYLDSLNLRMLKDLNQSSLIEFNANDKTYRITKPNNRYRITSGDDTNTDLVTDYNFDLKENQQANIIHNSAYYKSIWIDNDDYKQIIKLKINTKYSCDIIVDPSTKPQTIAVKILSNNLSMTAARKEFTLLINDDLDFDSEYIAKYNELFPSPGSNYTMTLYS